jgi:hypothetical protein
MSDCELFKTRAMEKIGQLKKQIAELEAQIPCWIPVTDRLPDGSKKVLATYINNHKKRRTICAMYIYPRTIQVEYFYSCDAEPDTDYDEENDKNWVEAGWCECLDNWPEYTSLDVCEGEVDHWMNLPSAPGVEGE